MITDFRVCVYVKSFPCRENYFKIQNSPKQSINFSDFKNIFILREYVY